MSLSRREFVWTMGAAGAALAFQELPGVFWAPEQETDVGWAPGIEERRRSTCLTCPARCGIEGRLVDGKLVRISGNPLHPMSRGGVCARGVAGVQLLYHPGRLGSPLVRTGARGSNEWRSTSPDEALALTVERLGALRSGGRPEALAVLAGYCRGSMHDLWQRFLEAFGSPNLVNDAYQDGMAAVAELAHGIRRPPGYDLERTDLALSFGAPLFEAWWSPVQAFVGLAGPRGRDEPRARLIQVDTRFSRTAARANEWVGVRPETYALLALGIAYVMIRDELVDARFLDESVSGFEDSADAEGRRREGYRSLVMGHYRTEEVSARTGVPVERITRLARAFGASRRAVAICGPDVTRGPCGLLAGLAVHSLNVLKGNIDRSGGILFGSDPPLAPLTPAVTDQEARGGLARRRVGGPPPPLLDEIQPDSFARAVARGDSGIEALLLYRANPLSSSSDPTEWRTALEKIPFIVSFSPFLDETTLYADLVLPDLLAHESWQDGPTPDTYPYPVWGVVRPLVEPFEGATHTGDALLMIARGLGGTVAESLPYEDFEGLLKERARGLFGAGRGIAFGNEFEREHHRQMEERGWWLPEHATFEGFWEQVVHKGGWTDLFYDGADPARISQVPGGRIELLPARLGEAQRQAGVGARPYMDVGPGDEQGSTEYPLRLLPYRLSTLGSGTLGLSRWMAEQPTIFPHAHWEPWVEVHPGTARGRGLEDGDFVWVVSPRGRYRARLRVFAGTAADNVCAPYGLRHPDGESANPLALIDGPPDPLTGLSSWSSTFVQLERV